MLVSTILCSVPDVDHASDLSGAVIVHLLASMVMHIGKTQAGILEYALLFDMNFLYNFHNHSSTHHS